MNKKAYIYKQLQLPFFLLSCSFVLAYWLNQYIEESELLLSQKHQAYLKEVDVLYNEVEQLKQKVELVNTYYGQFQQIIHYGLIGQQDRVSWIDKLMKLVIERDIRQANLSFSAREIVMPSELMQLKSGIGLLQKEQLILEGQLQHEADLFSLVDKLKQEINPMIQLDTCSITNPKSIFDVKKSEYHFRTDGGNFNFKCVFNFLFLVLPEVQTTGSTK